MLFALAPPPAAEPIEVEPLTATALVPQATEAPPVAVAPPPGTVTLPLTTGNVPAWPQTNCATAGRGPSAALTASVITKAAVQDEILVHMLAPKVGAAACVHMTIRRASILLIGGCSSSPRGAIRSPIVTEDFPLKCGNPATEHPKRTRLRQRVRTGSVHQVRDTGMGQKRLSLRLRLTRFFIGRRVHCYQF